MLKRQHNHAKLQDEGVPNQKHAPGKRGGKGCGGLRGQVFTSMGSQQTSEFVVTHRVGAEDTQRVLRCLGVPAGTTPDPQAFAAATAAAEARAQSDDLPSDPGARAEDLIRVARQVYVERLIPLGTHPLLTAICGETAAGNAATGRDTAVPGRGGRSTKQPKVSNAWTCGAPQASSDAPAVDAVGCAVTSTQPLDPSPSAASLPPGLPTPALMHAVGHPTGDDLQEPASKKKTCPLYENFRADVDLHGGAYYTGWQVDKSWGDEWRPG